jgi:hypothetical protein
MPKLPDLVLFSTAVEVSRSLEYQLLHLKNSTVCDTFAKSNHIPGEEQRILLDCTGTAKHQKKRGFIYLKHAIS